MLTAGHKTVKRQRLGNALSYAATRGGWNGRLLTTSVDKLAASG